MNIFVTGGTGGLGRDLVLRLLERGHQITLLSRSARADCLGARTALGDLRSPDTYFEALHGHDAVLHLAAVTHTMDTDLYYAVNTRGTEALAEAAARAGVRRFVYVSTRAVGASCGAYGESKALAEDAVRASGLDWTILRPSEVYDAPLPHSGHCQTPCRNAPGGEAVNRMIQAVLKGAFVPCVAHPGALLAPAFRENVVSAMAACLDCPVAVGKTYVLAGPQEMTQTDLARLLMRLLGRSRPVLPVPVFVLRLVGLASRMLRLRRPPFVPDQIPRLLCSKENAIDTAVHDLGFVPRSLEQVLRS